ncbi:hypothetical protein J5N97_014849 [Dioscorea zingiberensis]|uniref:Uncharacterized protein n=1 Tax=Dioscorea zingiberensis TaxID=325984 RepID=A0A9D5CW30_9LILI|nr:hypothetical protein J5N97_014849 [Dioscorea zingiberensis]
MARVWRQVESCTVVWEALWRTKIVEAPKDAAKNCTSPRRNGVTYVDMVTSGMSMMKGSRPVLGIVIQCGDLKTTAHYGRKEDLKQRMDQSSYQTQEKDLLEQRHRAKLRERLAMPETREVTPSPLPDEMNHLGGGGGLRQLPQTGTLRTLPERTRCEVPTKGKGPILPGNKVLRDVKTHNAQETANLGEVTTKSPSWKGITGKGADLTTKGKAKISTRIDSQRFGESNLLDD